MLVLTRYEGQSIVIGEPGPNQIRIQVLMLNQHKARLGITAPAHVPVHRDEVAQKIEQKGRNGKEV